MKKIADSKCVRDGLWLVLLLCIVPTAWAGVYQHGMVVRMRMGDCLPAHRGFMVAFGGPQVQMATEACPEYTLVSDKVVYVIVGRSSNQLVPLADIIDFRLQNNELAVRVDDARKESKFGIKEMVLRSEWDMVQKHITDQMDNPDHSDSSMPLRSRN
jgi:hypothetical protein